MASHCSTHLENPMDRGGWWAAVHGVTKSQTWLSDFTFTFHFYALERAMALHSSVLAWRIPGTGEPGGLPSLGSHRVGHDWSDLAAAAAAVAFNLTAAIKQRKKLLDVLLQIIVPYTCFSHCVRECLTAGFFGPFSVKNTIGSLIGIALNL